MHEHQFFKLLEETKDICGNWVGDRGKEGRDFFEIRSIPVTKLCNYYLNRVIKKFFWPSVIVFFTAAFSFFFLAFHKRRNARFKFKKKKSLSIKSIKKKS